MIDMILSYMHRSGRLPGACVFSHEAALLFHGPTQSLRKVVAANYCETSYERILCRTRGEGPHPVYRPSLQGG